MLKSTNLQVKRILKHYPPIYSYSNFVKIEYIESARSFLLSAPEFRLLAPMFSSITKVNFVAMPGWAVKDQELLGLLHLERLHGLSICGDSLFPCGATFNGGVLPLLKKFGPTSLTSLFLCYIDNGINIRTIVEYCPLLEKLDIETFEVEGTEASPDQSDLRPSKRIKSDFILEKLKILKLYRMSIDVGDISSENLDLLLSSPALVKLVFDLSGTLNDSSLRKAENLHQFRNLEELEFIACPNLTNQGIDIFMSEHNSLKVLKIDSCEPWEQEVEEWRKMAREKNWALDIEYTYDE